MKFNVFLGGELISIYEKDGEEGVIRFAEEKILPMLYNEGTKPQLIKFADYVKWKKTLVSFHCDSFSASHNFSLS